MYRNSNMNITTNIFIKFFNSITKKLSNFNQKEPL